MTPSIKEQVASAFVTLLEGITDINNLNIYRNYDSEISKYPCLNVMEIGQQVSSDEAGFTRYDMAITVEGFVRDEAGTEIGPLMNELHAKLIEKVYSDRTLGGLTMDINEENADFEVLKEPGKPPISGFVQSFIITYFTKQGDPYSVGP